MFSLAAGRQQSLSDRVPGSARRLGRGPLRPGDLLALSDHGPCDRRLRRSATDRHRHRWRRVLVRDPGRNRRRRIVRVDRGCRTALRSMSFAGAGCGQQPGRFGSGAGQPGDTGPHRANSAGPTPHRHLAGRRPHVRARDSPRRCENTGLAICVDVVRDRTEPHVRRSYGGRWHDPLCTAVGFRRSRMVGRVGATGGWRPGIPRSGDRRLPIPA